MTISLSFAPNGQVPQRTLKVWEDSNRRLPALLTGLCRPPRTPFAREYVIDMQ